GGAGRLAGRGAVLARRGGGRRVRVPPSPVCLPAGRPEKRTRALRALDGLLEVARRGGIGLWLHGHRHDAYYHAPSKRAPFPVVCAGSATQSGRWSYGEYTLTGRLLAARQRVYDPGAGAFRDGEAFEAELTGA